MCAKTLLRHRAPLPSSRRAGKPCGKHEVIPFPKSCRDEEIKSICEKTAKTACRGFINARGGEEGIFRRIAVSILRKKIKFNINPFIISGMRQQTALSYSIPRYIFLVNRKFQSC
jgi:hypothetical protein